MIDMDSVEQDNDQSVLRYITKEQKNMEASTAGKQLGGKAQRGFITNYLTSLTTE